jgi:hypothetical protein
VRGEKAEGRGKALGKVKEDEYGVSILYSCMKIEQ